MYDKMLVLDLLRQIKTTLYKIKTRSAGIAESRFFTDTEEGEEKLDGICMLFLAVGESLKSMDKITGGLLLGKYPDVDWIGAKGFRDVIAHQFFNIDAEEVFGIIQTELEPLMRAVDSLIKELE